MEEKIVQNPESIKDNLNRFIDTNKSSGLGKITIAEEPADAPDAILLMDELSQTLEAITGSSGKNSFDPRDVSVPRAVFVLARTETGELAGCGAIRPINESAGEIKRVYAKVKTCGVGTQILAYLENKAQKLGYSSLCLETRLINHKAVSFYEKLGYHRIPNYGKYVGKPESVCFEKQL